MISKVVYFPKTGAVSFLTPVFFLKSIIRAEPLMAQICKNALVMDAVATGRIQLVEPPEVKRKQNSNILYQIDFGISKAIGIIIPQLDGRVGAGVSSRLIQM